MLKIGDFSRLSRVSIRMLRYYDEHDLLKPFQIDDDTGYRYYHENQLSKIARIVELRNMGFSVSSIREILTCEGDTEALKKMFAVQKAQLLEESEAIRQRVSLLDAAVEKLRKDKIMNYKCELKELKERKVASVRMIIPKYEEEGRLWHVLFSETKSQNLQVCGAAMAVLHDKEYKEVDVDVEVQVEVNGNYQDTEHVKFHAEPACTVISATFKGSYSQFSDVYRSLATWVADNGYEFAGPMMDVYHVGPNDTRNPDEFVTEVCCAVKKSC